MALLFNHDLRHHGNEVQKGRKYIMKTELIFQRTDFLPFPPTRLGAYKYDPLYKQAVELYKLAEQLETKGDVSGSTAAYLKALGIFTSCTDSKHSSSW